jgi:hypothetical protein
VPTPMTCQHNSIQRRIAGKESTCILCSAPLIFDGHHWVHLYSTTNDWREVLRSWYRASQATS